MVFKNGGSKPSTPSRGMSASSTAAGAEDRALDTSLLVGGRPPPAPSTGAYSPRRALEDLPAIHFALQLFLGSQMVESEEFCKKRDPELERLYMASGYCVIQAVKAAMSYEDADILAALGYAKHGYNVAVKHRKRAPSLTTRLAGLVVGDGSASGVGFIKSMTPVERHAELVYVESMFQKAMLGILYSGDWLAFVKEALNLRATFNIYRDLSKFLEAADAAALARGEGPEDAMLDAHFRSGVYLGVGSCNLVLSLMPGRLLTLAELFGYKGDRHVGLAYLARAGGWTKESEEPGVSTEQEGIRRSICDMMLLIFHLVMSSITVDGVDLAMAQKILAWNSRRYPNGVFFLFGSGRIALRRAQPARALAFYEQAMAAQSQYRNLHHVSFWEMAVANFALWDVDAALACWRTLEREATWSKACYTYGMAVCLLEVGGEENEKEAAKLMERVPGLRQRIAGKSIPLEKFIARKSRKFASQQQRLLLPALELAYVFHAPAHAPTKVLRERMLPRVAREGARLTALLPAAPEAGAASPPTAATGAEPLPQGFWDDYCLARFLEGVCLRFVAYPDAYAIPEEDEAKADDAEREDSTEGAELSQEEAGRRSQQAFEDVFTYGPKIELDHHIVYYAHYELGRLLACKGDTEGARRHLDLVLSGKPLEVNAAGKKGKYSLENSLHLRTHAAVEALDSGQRL